MKKQQNFQMHSQLKKKMKISPLNGALQKQQTLTHVQLEDVIWACLENCLLQKSTSRNCLQSDQKLYESVVIALRCFG